jgi:hypothetical protein
MYLQLLSGIGADGSVDMTIRKRAATDKFRETP